MNSVLAVVGGATLFLVGGIGMVPVAQAAVDAECRQEAADYNIDAELVEQYVVDCVASRGGVESEEVSEEEPMSAVDAEALDAGIEISSEAAQ